MRIGSRPLVAAVALAAWLLCLLSATPAAAQSPEPDTTGTSGLAQSLGAINVDLHDRHDPFDIRRSFNGLQLGLGFFQARNTRTDRAQRGWELSLGRDIELRRSHFFLLGNSTSSFRAFDSKSFSLVMLQPSVAGGVYFGPAEVGAGAALTLFSVDDFDTHYSAQSLSPRVHADVALRLGGLRFGAQIFGEEYWRWFGDDRRMRGFAFTISLDQTPTL